MGSFRSALRSALRPAWKSGVRVGDCGYKLRLLVPSYLNVLKTTATKRMCFTKFCLECIPPVRGL